MYVNTLITLQENVSTYGIDGNKVTGHVTLSSPGLIKCYVQNLKKPTSGQLYALYAFSKASNKGVRLGQLGDDKETKWIVSAKDIEGSGLKLEEIDGVAIVVEDDMRGANTVLMGFKENRYMIIPLIDQIFQRRPKPQKLQHQGGYENPSPSPKPPHQEGHGNPPPPPRLKNKKIVKNIVEAEALPTDLGPIILPKGAKVLQSKPSTQEVIIQQGPGPVIPNESVPIGQQGPGTVIPNESMPIGQQGPGPVIPNASMPIEEQGPGPVIPNEGMLIEEQGLENVEQDETQEPSTGTDSEGLNDYVKIKILDKEPKKVEATERIDTINGELLKIAEKLRDIQTEASLKKQQQSDINNSSMNIPSVSENRAKEVKEESEQEKIVEKEEKSEGIKETKSEINKIAQELQRIINMLRNDQKIKQKAKGIQEQIEKMRQLPQSHKLTQKSPLEKTIESRYMAQQIDGINQVELDEEIEEHTCPKEAVSFILKNCKEDKKESMITEEINEDSQERGRQEEINYIKEIDKKIKEIEAKRRQERGL